MCSHFVKGMPFLPEIATGLRILVVSTFSYHAGDQGSIPGVGMFLFLALVFHLFCLRFFLKENVVIKNSN